MTKQLEIERKFLVENLPNNLDIGLFSEISQGYISVANDGTEVRLRQKGRQHTLTVKQGEGMVRGEIEINITPEQFDALWPVTEGRRIKKRRHKIPLGNVEIELDLYTGVLANLIVAEIEFPSEPVARDFEPPDWFQKEVTGDQRYKNQWLALHGKPE